MDSHNVRFKLKAKTTAEFTRILERERASPCSEDKKDFRMRAVLLLPSVMKQSPSVSMKINYLEMELSRMASPSAACNHNK